MRKKIGIGILGFGTVGSGVVKILRDNADVIQRRVGLPLEVVKIVDHDMTRDRGISLPAGVLSRDPEDVLINPSVDIVVELIGGEEEARTLILTAFRRKKHVVTANKALLAVHGEELYQAAEEAGVDFGFEASVGGGIPIIRVLKEGLAAERIESLYGIINGTSNYILSKMTEEGRGFSDVLAEAQKAGYAEADPALDVEGVDSSHKLAILATLAFGTPVPLKEIYTEGITGLTPLDVEYARAFGYRVKLLAIAKRGDGDIEVRVHPTMVSDDHLIATVDGVYNAIYVRGNAVGETLFYGKGAGSLPAGSAVVSDLIEISRNLRAGSSRRVPVTSFLREKRIPLRIRSMEEIRGLYYLRFMVMDRPGVLSAISGVLGTHNISISSVIQKARSPVGPVPVVMMTHEATERDVRAALTEINQLPFVSEKTALMRVEGQGV